MAKTIDREALPAWAREIADAYLSGAASLFLLHANVFDLVLYKGEALTLREFLCRALLGIKDTVIFYNISEGLGFPDAASEREFLTGVGRARKGALPREPAEVLLLLERFIRTGKQNAAIVLDYVDQIAPAGLSSSFLSASDRMAGTTLQRWALDPQILQSDTIILLIAQHASEVTDGVRRSPQVRAIRVPLPDQEERGTHIEHLLQEMPAVTLADGAPAQLAGATAGLMRLHLLHLFREAGGRGSPIRLADLAERKKEIIERECGGLVELIRPGYGLEAVAGMEEAKRALRQVVQNVRAGAYARVPMGIAFIGPMGTAKTFTATAFAGECGMACVKFRNIYERWVGASEGNLEKVLDVVEALGPVMLVIDEIDRAMAGGRSEGDSGTSSRIYARLKEFMSDTSHRGRIITLVLSNRPDRVDPDIFRAGRIDLKIPFFLPETPEEREVILRKMAEKNGIVLQVTDGLRATEPMNGASGADIEAVVLRAAQMADEHGRPVVTDEDLQAAALDYIPLRDEETLAYMTLLAVYYCSSRRLLPERFRELSGEELRQRLRGMRMD
ncbi:MAG: ATP-binding protein [Candidatus Tectomicrobia bacterium]|uniref:ATP-binding protein n=1 Tax=Tectimicrobiota bacterium TaxID=2528274 RepID=A0A932CRC9_UNCTE|nr:ATP-binding protein [Candidatus Tectomicrobia bacterium]